MTIAYDKQLSLIKTSECITWIMEPQLVSITIVDLRAVLKRNN